MTLIDQSTRPHKTGRVILRDRTGPAGDRWLSFRHPLQILETFNISEVPLLLAEVEAAVQQGLYAAGYLCYEAVPAFDPALSAYPPKEGLPLAWFGLFETLDEIDPAKLDRKPGRPELDWEPSISEEAYRRSLTKIFDQISQGETYQVNYTYQLYSAFDGSSWELFLAMLAQQRNGYHAFIDTGRHVICSASPELFFSLNGHSILCRPMKGTAPRGRTLEEDFEQAAILQKSAKERAENVMIVDMIRNDLGQIATPGTVSTTSLFDIEKYETLFQMTSTVVAKTSGSISEIFRALFPCASITGAPKVRATKLIQDLEISARGIYTGAIGFVLPDRPERSARSDRRAQFNVAIRTVHIDQQGHDGCTAKFGTGSGIVWDSHPAGEYRESQTKALVLKQPKHEFSLLETMLWTPAQGVRLRSRHISRLDESATYFDFNIDISRVEEELDSLIATLPHMATRLRLTVNRRGEVLIDVRPIEFMPGESDQARIRKTWRVGWAREAIDSSNKFLFHKTTARSIYDSALAEQPDCDDVLLRNERGDVTESCLANVVLQHHGRLTTPPLSSGLLPGTLRAELLHRGRVLERVASKEDVEAADRIFLINSVRGWIRVELMPRHPIGAAD